MGYLDTRQKIIDTLTGRAVGTQIQPTDHQEFALALLDYIRQVELITASTLVGTAERGTVPVQSDKANLAYVAACPVGETVVFENFHGQDGQPLQYTADVNSAAIIILTWNKEYWIMTAVPASVLVTADNVNYTTSIRKTYASKAEMEADKNPVDEKNIPITNGQLVSVVNDSDTTHNGIYAREGAGWKLQISFNLVLAQTTGQDVNKAMSQKATTDALDKYRDDLLQRIQGRSSESKALDDPFIWLGEFNDTEAFGEYAKDMLLSDDFLKYVGHGRAMVSGTNQDIWTYFMGTIKHPLPPADAYELNFFVQKTRGRYGANALGNLALSDDRDILEAERKVTVKRFMGGSPAVFESVSSWVDSGATVKDLGVFNSTSEVMAAASKIDIVRDYRIAMMVARVNTSDNSKKNSIVINQQITANNNDTYTTWQYIFEKNQRYTRYIESNARAVTSVQSVQKDGVRNIEYGQLGYLKLTDMHGSQVGASVNMKGIDQSALREENSTTENVRLVQTKTFGNTNEVLLTPATSAKAGVMTVDMYNKVQSLETNQTNLSTRITEVENKQTTDSARITSEVTARTTADAKLLQRIQGRDDVSSAHTDPILYIGEWSNTTNEDGTTVYATDLFDSDVEQMLCSSATKYLGRNRATVLGCNVDLWCYYVGNTEVTEGGNEYDIKTFALALDSMYNAVNGYLRLGSTYPMNKVNRCCRTVKIRYPKGVFTGGTVVDVTGWEYDNQTVRLGAFTSYDEFLAKAKSITYIQDYRVYLLVGYIYNRGRYSNVLIIQDVQYNGSNFVTIQKVFYEGNIKERKITSTPEGSITSISELGSVYARNLTMGPLKYLKLTDINDNQVGSSVDMRGNDQSALREENSTTENVRLVQTKTFGNTNEVLLTPATSAKAGVMTVDMYTRLETLWHLLNGGEPQVKAANEGGMSIASTMGMMPGSIVEFIQTPPSSKSNISNPIQLAIGDKISIQTNAALLQKMSDTSAKVLAYSYEIEYTATQAMVVYIYNENLPISYTHTPGSILNALEARIAALESK